MPASELVNIVRQTRYPLEAFLFVQRGLDYTVRHTHGELEPAGELDDDARSARHVSGEQLCFGLRDFAVQEYGLMARGVLRRWRIYSCEDFGNIVFAMVEGGMMHTTAEDSIDDFIGVFDFDEAFGRELQLN